MTPMTLAWFSKGKGKDREAKDKQLNGHRFGTGPCLGPTLSLSVFPSDFTVRESPPHSVIPISVSQPVLTPKERKDTVTQSCSLPGSLPNSDRSLSNQT
ncbi:hypothetical protein GOODEAATRI_012778 [Goodea atripinnis]|uniref:Uncharacterized protein n=1 Tax=Goodea atripinnis TaxID=208336 RepID=A0ABV0NA66_9TELE